MSELMYRDDFTKIINIDISDVVIKKMNEIYNEKCPLMKCKRLFNL